MPVEMFFLTFFFADFAFGPVLGVRIRGECSSSTAT